MNLKDYIETRGISPEQAAKELKISRGYLYELRAGRILPGRKTALRIVSWSNNFVKLSDLWKEVYYPPEW